MNRKQHKNIINSHVISQLTYAMPIWSGSISFNDNRRLSSLLFKIIRLHGRDFSNIFTNKQLCERTDIRSLNSLRILADCNMLHRLITYPMNTEITLRLIQQSTFSVRFPNRLIFFDFSSKRVGRSSFINRAKEILNHIPFEWHQMSTHRFKKSLKITTPIYIQWMNTNSRHVDAINQTNQIEDQLFFKLNHSFIIVYFVLYALTRKTINIWIWIWNLYI